MTIKNSFSPGHFRPGFRPGVSTYRAVQICGATSEFVYVSEEKADALRANTAARGDLIFTQRGTLGQVGLIPGDSRFERYVVSQSQMKLTADPSKADPRFIYHYFSLPTVVDEIKARVITSGVPHINLGILKELQVPLPPVATQRRIADIASEYDDLIENNQRRIKLLEEAARRLYHEWFVALRLPGHSQTAMAGGIPHDWRRVNLYEFAELTMGFPFQANAFNGEGNGTPIIRIRDILDLSPVAWTTESPPSPEYWVERGDFLVGMDGFFHMNHWAGKAALLVQRVCRIRPRNMLYRGFLAQALFAPIKHFEATISGATVAHLGAKHLRSIELLVPPVTSSTCLKQLNLLLDQKLYLVEMNQCLKQARDALLPRLMSGALAV